MEHINPIGHAKWSMLAYWKTFLQNSDKTFCISLTRQENFVKFIALLGLFTF